MEPNQNASSPNVVQQPGIPNPILPQKSTFTITIIIAWIIIFAIVLGFSIWKWKTSYTNNVVIAPVDIKKDIADNVEEKVSYKTSKIENINLTFNLSSFPKADFSLVSINKIDNIRPQACGEKWPQEVTDKIKISNGCWDLSIFDPNIDYSLVGINLRVENNSFNTVQGDLIKLGYFKTVQSKDFLRFAQRDIDFNSYAVGEAEEKYIQLSFWVPTEKTELYLLYGATTDLGTDFTTQTQITMKNFDGALKIDFTTLTVSLINTKLKF
jgi:hypothetical protein